MTHTDQLRRALRAYDLAGPATPERAAALAAVAAIALTDDEIKALDPARGGARPFVE